MNEIPEIDFKPGQTFRAKPSWSIEIHKIHIVSVIDEGGIGVGPQIVYRLFGKYKQWWHYYIESASTVSMYIWFAKEKEKQKQKNEKA